MQLATKEEIEALPQAWETAGLPSQTLTKSGILKEPEFDLNKVKGPVKLTKSITIGPFQTVHISGLTECRQHFKRVNVMVKPDPNKKYEMAIQIYGYTVLKPDPQECLLVSKILAAGRLQFQLSQTLPK